MIIGGYRLWRYLQCTFEAPKTLLSAALKRYWSNFSSKERIQRFSGALRAQRRAPKK
ncbi:hypothetical protein SynROS8604_03592 [Synechococcus sp. ROS8604]|nr:hypothetical protein SynROS8604_03592 [Synechococcus sp. ROS8604]